MAEHDIGATLAGAPVDDKPNGALEFLKKPENLATALVLAAALTSQRKPGQSRLNQGLTAGVGALAFRGGLEKGVQGQRADLREEERVAAESAANITQGKDRTAVLQESNRIAEKGQTTVRPLPESESLLNKANASLQDARAANVGILPKPLVIPETFSTLFAKNKELAIANALPGATMNLAQIAADTNRELVLTKVFAEGRIFPNGDLDLTPEESALLGIVPLEPVETPAEVKAKEKAKKKKGKEDLSISGSFTLPFNQTKQARVERTLVVARRNPNLEGLPDALVLERIGEVRAQIRDKKQLEAMAFPQLQELLDLYGELLDAQELRNIRSEIRRKTL